MSIPRISPAHIGAIVDALDAWSVGWLALDRALTTANDTPAATSPFALRTVAELGHNRTGQYLASLAHAGQLEDWGPELAGDEPLYTHVPAPVRPAVQVLKLVRTLALAACAAPGWDDHDNEAREMLAALTDAATVRLDHYHAVPGYLPETP